MVFDPQIGRLEIPIVVDDAGVAPKLNKTKQALQATTKEAHGTERQSKNTALGILEMARGAEDAAVGFGVGGLSGAARGAGNNVARMAEIMAGPGVGALAGFGVAGVALIPILSRLKEGSKEAGDEFEALAERGERAAGAIKQIGEREKFRIAQRGAAADERSETVADLEQEREVLQIQLDEAEERRRRVFRQAIPEVFRGLSDEREPSTGIRFSRLEAIGRRVLERKGRDVSGLPLGDQRDIFRQAATDFLIENREEVLSPFSNVGQVFLENLGVEEDQAAEDIKSFRAALKPLTEETQELESEMRETKARLRVAGEIRGAGAVLPLGLGVAVGTAVRAAEQEQRREAALKAEMEGQAELFQFRRQQEKERQREEEKQQKERQQQFKKLFPDLDELRTEEEKIEARRDARLEFIDKLGLGAIQRFQARESVFGLAGLEREREELGDKGAKFLGPAQLAKEIQQSISRTGEEQQLEKLNDKMQKAVEHLQDIAENEGGLVLQ